MILIAAMETGLTVGGSDLLYSVSHAQVLHPKVPGQAEDTIASGRM